jgi:hypothetical protein
MGIQLVELDDWNCCGATEYFSQDDLTACAVIARNLALVEADDQFVEDVRKLGPLNWAENWEENGERFQALEDIVREHEEAMEVPR